MRERAAKALDDFDAGLADDLNTAVALAATFDFVREAILRWIVADSVKKMWWRRRNF